MFPGSDDSKEDSYMGWEVTCSWIVSYKNSYVKSAIDLGFVSLQSSYVKS